MPKSRKIGRVRDKWKLKSWVVVEAPTSFGKTSIAYIPITDTESVIGQVVETTLYELVKQDIQDQTKKLFFEIDSINDGKASSTLKGFEYSREYLRSLVRRGSSMISLVEDYITKDKVKVRVYSIALAHRRMNTSRKHTIRSIMSNIVTEKTNSISYDQFAQEVVLGKIASDIYNEAKKITHLRHVGIRKTKVLEKGDYVSATSSEILPPESMENETLEEVGTDSISN